MASSVFTVMAKANAVSGGTGLDTGVAVEPGQVLVISVDPNDTWSAGTGERTSNANGLGNPLGGDFGLFTRGEQSFLYGSLVGSFDGGKTFFGVGTNLTMTVLTKGTLTLYYWDSNNAGNSDGVRGTINLYTGPTNVDG